MRAGSVAGNLMPGRVNVDNKYVPGCYRSKILSEDG